MFGDNFAKHLQSIPLSNDTVFRRIDDIAEDVDQQIFVAALKTKYRSQLNTEQELRESVSNIKPSFENLFSARQAHGCH
ncbi:hypothetical protein TNCV_395451 [Trichonephila clavipes]|nr:hypothetical protein TNCV_395451 [Trichonephila clavipes]